jgi:hypothetical protein
MVPYPCCQPRSTVSHMILKSSDSDQFSMVQVELDAFLERGVAAPAVDLPSP